ncbi:MAG TPA: gamma-glutamylcyclotransferase family protein [Streptosporangiaceae bacterium]
MTEEAALAGTLVWTFFYGSYINSDVLDEVDFVPRRTEIARLAGFEIRIAPLANLVQSDRGVVYGVLASGTHAELERLYAHAEHVLGGVYLPRAVLAERLDGSYRPALCYIASEMAEAPPDPNYVQRIVEPARRFGFPAWYVDRLDSFIDSA